MTVLNTICWLLLPNVAAFTPIRHRLVDTSRGVSLGAKRRVLVKEKSSFHGSCVEEEEEYPCFDPFHIASGDCLDEAATTRRAALSFATAAVPLTALAGTAVAATTDVVSTGDFDPKTFSPVCPASDGIYRGLQTSIEALVGDEAFVQYGPLIAGGLLRIRLELCVVESFFNEAVGPFIEKNGISWVLPLHETVETFLAGVIFSLASTFILVGSTKIVSVLITYFDLFLGLPARLIGGFFFDRARGKPVTLDIGFGPVKKRVIGPEDYEEAFIQKNDIVSFIGTFFSGIVKLFGEICRVIREFAESLDLFVGRYLIMFATFYIGIKILHFRVFPDFPNF